MPEFQYQGIDKAGKKVIGKMNTPSEGDLRMALRSQGVRPIRISQVSALHADLGALLKGGAPTIKMEALVAFTRQLHVLISSGVPLVQALEVLSEQSTDKNLRNAVLSIRERVSQGEFLWQALSAYSGSFPKIYVSLIRAGEASGAMDQVLRRLSRYLEDADRLRKMLKSAMMYPVIVVLISIGVIWVMLTFVIPKFEELLRGSGQELPLPTQFVITLSHFLANNVIYVVGGVGLLGYLTRKYVRSQEGKAFIDRALFRLPLFGVLVQKAGVARFARTLQTLLGAGVTLIDAMDICKTTIDNAVLEEAVSKIREEVEGGRTFGAVLGRLGVFPPMAVQMISVGESTGSLDKMLEKVADFYEAEVETAIGGLTKLIEPIMLVFLGGVVGGLMIAMYLPIFKMAGSGGSP